MIPQNRGERRERRTGDPAIRVLTGVIQCLVLMQGVAAAAAGQTAVTRYVRYAAGDAVSYGILEGETIREVEGDVFASPRPTGRTVQLSAVRLLAPVAPSKVIAVGLNYRSHLGTRPVPQYPGLFAKYPTSIIGPGDDIVLPADATQRAL